MNLLEFLDHQSAMRLLGYGVLFLFCIWGISGSVNHFITNYFHYKKFKNEAKNGRREESE
ncbi:hypothetical protein [Sunxiuqinia indica]|uniref:hypothetical protein n=1 Tax=Sunxiuqinia indica TaxID=2692584 RepID=UPI00135CE3A8|nr:hypothetical protein [Sunxiuqinia indica]